MVGSLSFGLASDECEDVRIDHIGIRGHHAVWEARINLERAIFEQLGLERGGVFVRHDLVVVTLHHQSRHRNRFQIIRLVGLGESFDAFVMSQRAAHHPLTPPILDDSLRSLEAWSVKAVKRTGSHIKKELSSVLGQRLAEAVEHFDRSASGVLLILDHEWGNSGDQHRFGYAALRLAVLRDIARYLATTRRMADVDCIPQVEML